MAEIIYSKYSNERCRRFAVRTDILEENGTRYVEKHAMYPEGKAHVASMADWYGKLNSMYRAVSMEAVRCETADEGVRLEYIQGKTMEEKLDALLLDGKQEEAAKWFEDYLSRVESLYQTADFMQTEQFREVFGEVDLPSGLKCSADVTNIDMVCANVVIGNASTVLDYEWTFDFPIPCKFVLYRIISYYMAMNTLREVLNQEHFYERFGITDDMVVCFREMEKNFQNYITRGHVPMRDMFMDITPGDMVIKESYARRLQVFFSDSGIYAEDNSCFYPMREGKAAVQVPLPADCRWVRLDPGDLPCAVHIENLAFDGKPVELNAENIDGGTLRGQWAFIPHSDPFIKGISVPEGAKEMEICLAAEVLSEELLKIVCKTNEENVYLHNKVRRMNQLINEMKNTKIWKLYGKYRNMVERKR